LKNLKASGTPETHAYEKTPVRSMPMRYAHETHALRDTPLEIHVYDMHVYEMYDSDIED